MLRRCYSGNGEIRLGVEATHLGEGEKDSCLNIYVHNNDLLVGDSRVFWKRQKMVVSWRNSAALAA